MLTVSSQRSSPELGLRNVQAVEDHHANGVLDRCGVACLAQYAGKGVKAQLFPQLIKRPDIAQRQRRFERYLRLRGGGSRQALGAQQAIEQRIDANAGFIDPTERGDAALAGPNLPRCDTTRRAGRSCGRRIE